MDIPLAMQVMEGSSFARQRRAAILQSAIHVHMYMLSGIREHKWSYSHLVGYRRFKQTHSTL